jgi:hypothetical protein
MPAAIQITPLAQGNSLNFGPFPVHTGISRTFFITNVGNSNLVFNTPAITLTITNGNPGDFTIPIPIDGAVLVPSQRIVIGVTFTPSLSDGVTETCTMQLNSNSVSGPTLITLTGISALNTEPFVIIASSFGGSAIVFPCIAFGNVNAGTAYTSGTITLFNPTTSSRTVTITPLIANGYTIVNTSGANPIVPGGSFTFQLQLIPIANRPNQDDVNAVVVTVPSQVYITNVEVTYNTQPITPVFPIGGTDFEMLLGFFNATGIVSLLQADGSNLQCEEDATIARQYDFKAPDMEKQLQRLLLRYERLGPAILTVTYQAVSPENQTPVTQTRTFDAATDSLLRTILYDGSIAGDIINITFTCLANQGPVSIALFAPYVEPRGEIIEGT